MKIVKVSAFPYDLPLKEPFTIALGTIETAKNVLVVIETDTGLKGYGEAAEMPFVTGEVQEGIIASIERFLKPVLLGEDPRNIEKIVLKMDEVLKGNNSAKAAADIALYDLIGKIYSAPLYQILGGHDNSYESDITIGINEPEKMAKDAMLAAAQGFSAVKIKVGKDIREDISRVENIRKAVGPDIKLRLDANQGWAPKDAVYAINRLKDFDLELVEQPVPYWDIDGLLFIKEHSDVPIMADESVFGPEEAARVIKENAVDLINIKLMKSGGLFKAKKINDMAEAAGIPCMVGCMLESKVAVTAAAHLVAASKNIKFVDLDSPLFMKDDFVAGGVSPRGGRITLSDSAGLGIENVASTHVAL